MNCLKLWPETFQSKAKMTEHIVWRLWVVSCCQYVVIVVLCHSLQMDLTNVCIYGKLKSFFVKHVILTNEVKSFKNTKS